MNRIFFIITNKNILILLICSNIWHTLSFGVGFGDKTPLYVAVQEGDSERVNELLNYGHDIDATIGDLTLLHVAAQSGYTSIVKALLKKGARIDSAENSNKETPLHCAIRNGHVATAALLIGYNASVELRDKNGYTPVEMARLYGRSYVVELLRSAIEKKQNIF